MILTEFYKTRDDGVNLYRTYSDQGLKIRQDGTDMEYNEAIDVEDSGFTYTETETPIPQRGVDVYTPGDARRAVQVLLNI